jgi:hypothetical protein
MHVLLLLPLVVVLSDHTSTRKQAISASTLPLVLLLPLLPLLWYVGLLLWTPH